jgi:hypothetical protein
VNTAREGFIAAVQNGSSVETSVEATPKKAGGRKRKAAAADEDGEKTSKKRGRPAKKDAAPKVEEDASVKDEPEGESELPTEDEV